MKLGPEEKYDPKNQEHNDPSKYIIINKQSVYDHVLSALRSSELSDPILNLSILFHDVGKILTQTKTSEGRIKYLGHAQKGSELIDDISNRLKLDIKTKNAMKFSALNHMKIHNLLDLSDNKLIRMMDDPNWGYLLAVGHMDSKARGQLFSQSEWDKIQNKIDTLTKQYANMGNDSALVNIRKVVNGNFIMDLKKIRPSKQLGDYIEKTINWIVDNKININDINKIKQYIMEL
jgi:hypothetical protein